MGGRYEVHWPPVVLATSRGLAADFARQVRPGRLPRGKVLGEAGEVEARETRVATGDVAHAICRGRSCMLMTPGAGRPPPRSRM